MTRKKLAGFGVRRPADSEEAIRRLEERTEARGRDVQTSKRSNTKTSERLDVEDPSLVRRVGRVKADGSRTPARDLRRLTLYLPPEMAKAVDMRALDEGVNRSELIQAALQAYLDS